MMNRLRPRQLVTAIRARTGCRPFSGIAASVASAARPSEESSTNEASKAPPPVEVYLNPICQQMDSKLRKLTTTEEVLTAIITHRGVMFVQNLVTAMEMLAHTVDDEAGHLVDVTRKGRHLMDQVMSAAVEDKETRKNMLVNDLTKDARYKLLLRDIGEYADSLDTRAIADVLGSLQSLGHRQFTLCGKLLRTLYKPGLSVDSLHTMLEIAGGLQWMGFIRAHKFYASLALAVSRAPGLTMEEIGLGMRAFGRLESVHPLFFEKVSSLVLQNDGKTLVPGLSLELITSLAIGFSKHRFPAHDSVILACADYLANNIEEFAEKDMFKEMIAIVAALDNHQLAHPTAMTKVLHSCVPVAKEGLTWGEPMGHVIGLSSFGDLLQACANFSVGEALAHYSPIIEYMVEHVDYVQEDTAIKALWATCLMPELQSRHEYGMTLLLRKLCSGTGWESEKLRVGWMWICQAIDFPYVDHLIPKVFAADCIREWIKSREGYSVPFAFLCEELSKVLTAYEIPHETCVHIEDTPYVADIVLTEGIQKRAIVILSEFSRNTDEPIGSAAIQVRHMKERGWHVIALNSRRCREMLEGLNSSSLQALMARVHREEPLTFFTNKGHVRYKEEEDVHRLVA
ncbi:hypothetical protein FOL47_010225 [Perkinsus chesapeaki]|uniref:Uncharacterized protein n=1 Tax=Perkinsus chesapeaki TaxID=330153 RepID=A0A7J6L2W7_PERCH|nr:hypothetical protein FOL47_010225 [Perkinsus chesapeaki]